MIVSPLGPVSSIVDDVLEEEVLVEHQIVRIGFHNYLLISN
jgi:hypothetical protein